MEQKVEQKAEPKNKMSLEFESRACNESFARVSVAAFLAQLNPTMEEVADVKTAVSEAITNAIIHAYDSQVKKIRLDCELEGNVIRVCVTDYGKGIEDVEKAMEPMYTTRPDLERSGMGFSFMEAFMDRLEVDSTPGHGTVVRMEKCIGRASGPEEDR
ncbi:MAG: anti-sigma F factor [Fusicatenibacter sp.]|nr:anti-sigma F factor [Fusicatenibacter sp.]